MISVGRGFVTIAVAGLLALSATLAVAQQSSRNSGNTEVLQRRLADAGCYGGPIDGRDSATLQAAIKACPSQEPVLRIETGMHLAPVKRIGVDRACRIGATGSYDKTVRVWSLSDGRLLHTLRVPIGPGDAGKIYSTAVSPDGRWVVAGGWDAQWDVSSQDFVYVFDASSGALVSRVGPFASVINHLVFSPDGQWLAALSSKNVGLKIIDTRNWHIVADDTDYADDSYGAAFAPDGRLYTVAYDGKLRRYGPAPHFKKEREIVAKNSKQPYGVAVDPHGQLVAVGFSDTRGVDVYDASTLAFRFSADTKAFDNGNLSKVAWNGDGTRLLAGGSYEAVFQGAWKSPLVTFDRNGKQVGTSLPLSDDALLNLLPCGDTLAVAAADPAFGIIGANNQVNLWKNGVAPDMRDKVDDAFTISPDARQIRFGLADRGGEPVLFDLGQATIADAPNPVSGLNQPIIEGLPVADWKNSYHPTFAGKPMATEQYETFRSLAVRPDHSGFVLGTEYLLRAYDAAGKELWEQAGPSIAWGVNFSADGRIIVVSYGDGTARWVRWSDGKELLALFVNRKTKAWVTWTPSGYYMASPGGEDLIGWHVNRGWNQAPDFFPVSQFAAQYGRADVVKRVLDTLDEQEAVRLASRSGARNAVASPIIESLPPVLSILSPADNTHAGGSDVTLTYLIRSPSGLPIDTMGILVDGQLTGTTNAGDDAELKRCIADTHGLGRVDGALQGCRGNLTVKIPSGAKEIGIFAKASDKTSNTATVHLSP